MKKIVGISLVIPCYNEDRNIDLLVERCKIFLQNKKNELLLVNNGSKDKTKKIILKYSKKFKNIKLVDIKKNIGFGYGVYKGLKKGNNQILSYTHADLQTNPIDVLKGIKLINKENILKQNFFIKGYRNNKLKNGWSFLSIFISTGMTIVESLLFRKILIDIHAQPVIFSKKFFTKIKHFPSDFTFDVWIYFEAKRKNLEIKRFNVKFDRKGRTFGEGNNDTFIKTLKGILEHLVGSIKMLPKSF